MRSLLIALVVCTIINQGWAQSLTLEDSHGAEMQVENGFSFHTNFIVPMTRFNFFQEKAEDGSAGRLILFNSVGAGIGLSKGRVIRYYDSNQEEIPSSRAFQNQYGLQFGLLFSSGSGAESTTVFAPTISFSMLDFQFGFGYELGNKSSKETGHFITISYGIPVYKISQKASFIFEPKPKRVKPEKKGDIEYVIN